MKITLEIPPGMREKAKQYINAENFEIEELIATYLSIKEQAKKIKWRASDPEEHQLNRIYLSSYALNIASSTYGEGNYKEEIENILKDTYLNGDEYEKTIAKKVMHNLNGTNVRTYISNIHKTTSTILEKTQSMYVEELKKLLVKDVNSSVRLEDIAGLHNAKIEIDKFVKAYTNHHIYQKNDARKSTGILLYGPPGNGKTMLGKAIANELDFNFREVKLPEIVSKYFGESENILHNIFTKAKEHPTVLFFDELDALANDRNNYENGANTRLVSTLLINLDGIDESKNIIPIGATNRIEHIDTALLRPGRFSKHIEIPLPDLKTREEMFKIKINKSKMHSLKYGGDGIFQELKEEDYTLISSISEGFSGAQINEVLEILKEEKSYNESIKLKTQKINIEDIEYIINKLRTSTHKF